MRLIGWADHPIREVIAAMGFRYANRLSKS